ncbi:hypothetical protein ACFE04_028799 [Oxalis oulophora]
MGKVVLITGAAGGIGEQMAYEYARRGACLVLVDIKEDSLDKVAKKATQIGSPDVLSLQADVSQPEQCKNFIDKAIHHFGRLDHLVNNAGIANAKLFVNMKQISDFTPTMDINFWGAVYGTHYALPHLRKSKGHITVISSICGWFPLPALSMYNSSKAALISFFETLRTEIGSEVSVTIVTPGLINSQMGTLAFIPLESAERCAKAIVRSGCRKDNYLVEPFWVRILFPFKVFCPEYTEFLTRVALAVKPQPTITEFKYSS